MNALAYSFRPVTAKKFYGIDKNLRRHNYLNARVGKQNKREKIFCCWLYCYKSSLLEGLNKLECLSMIKIYLFAIDGENEEASAFVSEKLY